MALAIPIALALAIVYDCCGLGRFLALAFALKPDVEVLYAYGGKNAWYGLLAELIEWCVPGVQVIDCEE